MTIIDKIIKGDKAPENTNVLWLNTEDNIIYVFNNGWVPTSTGAAASVYTGTEAERLAIEDPFNGLEFHQVDENGKVTRYLYEEGAWRVVVELTPEDAEYYHELATEDHQKAVADHQNAIDDHAQYLVDHESIAHKANVDGYYATMSVGSADNLNGQNADTDTWEERPVGGEGAEVATGLASVQAIGGNGLVWNQKAYDINSTNYHALRTTVASFTDGIASFVAGGNYQGVASTGKIQIIKDHVYYSSAEVMTTTDKIRISDGGNLGLYIAPVISASSFTRNSVIRKASADILTAFINVWDTRTADFDEVKVRNIQIIDLSLIYGLGNEPTSVDQVEADLAKLIAPKPYYPYNAGTLLPAKLQAYKTTGRSANLLNPTTRTARLFAYTWPDHNNMFTIKELPSDLTLTFTPDATGVAETISPDSNGHFSISGSGNLVVSGSADLSATWLIATWDESMDSYDNFGAWDGKEYAFDVTKVYGKLNGAGDYVQVFPNGMRGVGSVHDLIDLQSMTADVNVGKVNIGSYNYNVQSGIAGLWASTGIPTNIKPNKSISSTPKIICERYATRTPNSVYARNIGISTTTVGYIWIFDDSYNSGTELKTALSGVQLWYELDTPLHYTDCVYRDNGVDTPLTELNILVNNWAYEQAVVAQQADAFSTEKAYAIGDYVTYSGTQYRFTAAKTAGAWDSTKVTADASPVSCAAQSTILYGIDAVEAIKTLQDAGIDIDAMHGNLDALLTALQTAGIIGSYTLGETPTNKIFSITVTAPSEPESEP